MCGIFCSLGQHAHLPPSQDIKERLKCRGPDSERGIQLHTADAAFNVTLYSTVLSLRGSQVTAQPYQDSKGQYVLCWNGEAWRIDGQSGFEDDTASMHELLSSALKQPGVKNSELDGANQIAGALSRVAGPYAFVFLDRDQGHLYFGRDFLGRRSLCWKRTSNSDVVLCSVTNGSASEGWQEVEADGVYVIDLVAPAMSSATAESSNDLITAARRVPYHFHGDGASVIPHLSLNKTLPSRTVSLDETSSAVVRLHARLRESLALRILNIPDPAAALKTPSQARIAVLFSGGLDCTVIARLCHDLLPKDEQVDLLNVAFENPRIHSKLEGGPGAAYELCPDRITGRASFEELQETCPGHVFRFVAINIPYGETLQHRETVISLMHPHNTEMDLSISYALYFAARGKGEVLEDSFGTATQYETSARVLLSGLGADELFGGYTRHATAFRRAGFSGLIDELELDVARLGKRNLGRDDRVISHWGREARFPFLDETLLAWALAAPVTEKCGFGEEERRIRDETAEIEPGKKVLRCLAWKLGMRKVAGEKKRAIQFGARTAKMETGRTKGTTLLS